MGARVTLRMGNAWERAQLAAGPLGRACEVYAATPVPPSEPRRSVGVYWGHSVRLARGLSGALAGCPYSVRRAPSLPPAQSCSAQLLSTGRQAAAQPTRGRARGLVGARAGCPSAVRWRASLDVLCLQSMS